MILNFLEKMELFFILVCFLIYSFKSCLIIFPLHHGKVFLCSIISICFLKMHMQRSQDLLSACSERDLLFIFPAISVHLCALVEMLLDPKKFIDETSRFRKETKAEKYQNGRWHFVIQYLCCLRHIYTVFKQDQSVQNCC